MDQKTFKYEINDKIKFTQYFIYSEERGKIVVNETATGTIVERRRTMFQCVGCIKYGVKIVIGNELVLVYVYEEDIVGKVYE